MSLLLEPRTYQFDSHENKICFHRASSGLALSSNDCFDLHMLFCWASSRGVHLYIPQCISRIEIGYTKPMLTGNSGPSVSMVKAVQVTILFVRGRPLTGECSMEASTPSTQSMAATYATVGTLQIRVVSPLGILLVNPRDVDWTAIIVRMFAHPLMDITRKATIDSSNMRIDGPSANERHRRNRAKSFPLRISNKGNGCHTPCNTYGYNCSSIMTN